MLLFLDIGGGELLVIILVGMLLFGKDKLPGILRGIARGTDYLKKASEEVKQQIHSETGLGETLEGLRDDLKKAGETAREDLREVADQVRETAEEVRIDPPREQATGEESPSAESPRPDTKP